MQQQLRVWKWKVWGLQNLETLIQPLDSLQGQSTLHRSGHLDITTELRLTDWKEIQQVWESFEACPPHVTQYASLRSLSILSTRKFSPQQCSDWLWAHPPSYFISMWYFSCAFGGGLSSWGVNWQCSSTWLWRLWVSGAIPLLLYAFLVYTATILSVNFLYTADTVLKRHCHDTCVGLSASQK